MGQIKILLFEHRGSCKYSPKRQPCISSISEGPKQYCVGLKSVITKLFFHLSTTYSGQDHRGLGVSPKQQRLAFTQDGCHTVMSYSQFRGTT